MKNAFDSAVDHTKKAVADVRDRADEALHASAADAEKTHRADAGDTLTTKERIASGAREIEHRTQVELDRAKRAMR